MSISFEIVNKEEVIKLIGEQLKKTHEYCDKKIIIKNKYAMYVEYGTRPAVKVTGNLDELGRYLYTKGIMPKRFVRKSIIKIRSKIERGDFNGKTTDDVARALAAEIRAQYKKAVEDSNAKLNIKIEDVRY